MFWNVTLTLLSGLGTTIQIFFLTLLFALPLGLVIAFGSMSRLTPLRWLCNTLVWIVRGTPLMLQLIGFMYIPGILGNNIWDGEAGRMTATVVAFSINYACYFSVIYRGGIQGVPAGQREAAEVLGLTKQQIFFKVTLLQMIKRIVPPMSNEIITLVKDTSLARIISVYELTFTGYSFMKSSGLVWPFFYNRRVLPPFCGHPHHPFQSHRAEAQLLPVRRHSMAILDVQHIEKSFGATKVLKDINFSLPEGQVLAIIGSSGSGKTTLLRCLNFLETPDKGSISVRGETLFDAGDPATQRESEIRRKRLHFGLVFQNFNLFPQYTALENVTLARELMAKGEKTGESLEDIRAEGRDLLTQMGLQDRMGNYPHQLSGGQQQRVAIARALAMKPDILCFDEPTSALDPELTGEVLKVIRSLADQHTTMIIVTHEMSFARDVADHVLFMDGGVVVEEGTPEEVFGHPQQARTRQFLEKYKGD